jgi:uncharacterized protein (DUF2147 family)
MTLDQLATALSGTPRIGAAPVVSPSRLGRFAFFAVLVGVLASFGVAAQERQKNESPLGLWETQGGGVIEIFWCGEVLCGSIVGIPRASGEPIPNDNTGRPECGMTIMRQVSERQDGSWSGHITDPRDGSQYHVKLWVDGLGRLHLRGYILLPLLGQTQIWHRFTGRLGAQCTIA